MSAADRGDGDAPGASARKPRILVAEDESSYRALLTLLLEMEGFEVDAVGNGQEALQHLSEVVPDLVLTDFYMPFMGGDELILAIRGEPAWERLPVILMSSEPASMLPAQERADLFLRKPFRIDALLKAIAMVAR